MADAEIAGRERLGVFEQSHQALKEIVAAGTPCEKAVRICEQVGRLVGSGDVALFVDEQDKGIWRCMSGIGKCASGYTGGYIESDESLLVENRSGALRAVRRANLVIHNGATRFALDDRFSMVVSVFAGSEVLGLLLCEFDGPHVIEDLQVLEGIHTFLLPVSGLLACHKEIVSLQEQSRSLALLYEIGSQLCSIRDEDKLLDAVLSRIERHLQVDRCSIMIIDQDRKYLSIKKARGMSDVSIKDVKVAVGEGIAGFVAAGTRPLLIRDISKEMHLNSQVPQQDRFTTNSLLSVPLVSRGETIGVINVNNRKDGQPFTEEDMALLFKIGSEIAAVLQRSYMALQLKKARELDRDIKRSMI